MAADAECRCADFTTEISRDDDLPCFLAAQSAKDCFDHNS